MLGSSLTLNIVNFKNVVAPDNLEGHYNIVLGNLEFQDQYFSTNMK